MINSLIQKVTDNMKFRLFEENGQLVPYKDIGLHFKYVHYDFNLLSSKEKRIDRVGLICNNINSEHLSNVRNADLNKFESENKRRTLGIIAKVAKKFPLVTIAIPYFLFMVALMLSYFKIVSGIFVVALLCIFGILFYYLFPYIINVSKIEKKLIFKSFRKDNNFTIKYKLKDLSNEVFPTINEVLGNPIAHPENYYPLDEALLDFIEFGYVEVYKIGLAYNDLEYRYKNELKSIYKSRILIPYTNNGDLIKKEDKDKRLFENEEFEMCFRKGASKMQLINLFSEMLLTLELVNKKNG